jgi:DNA-binding MarR family transcriptional regulator
MNESGLRLMRNSHVLARLVEQVLEEGYLRQACRAAVTFDQLNILKFLNTPGVKLVKDVARFLNASYAAASKAVSRLKRKGWVRTKTCGTDRRAEIVEVTGRGGALIRKYEALKAKRVSALLRGVDADRLSGSLEQLIAVLLRERARAGDPCLGCGAYYARQCVVRAHGYSCRCG